MDIFLIVLILAVVAWILVDLPGICYRIQYGKMDKWIADPLDFDIRFNPHIPEERELAEKLKEHYYGPRPSQQSIDTHS